MIGTGNKLPWRLSGDLQRVKAITMGHHLIMGRKTYESIGRPLPGRTTVIISRSRDLQVPGCIVVGSLDKAIEVSQTDSEAFILAEARYSGPLCLSRIGSTIHAFIVRLPAIPIFPIWIPTSGRSSGKSVFRRTKRTSIPVPLRSSNERSDCKKMSAIGGHFLMLAGSYFLQQSDFFSGQGVPLPHLMPLASQAFMQASLHWPPP